MYCINSKKAYNSNNNNKLMKLIKYFLVNLKKEYAIRDIQNKIKLRLNPKLFHLIQ